MGIFGGVREIKQANHWVPQAEQAALAMGPKLATLTTWSEVNTTARGLVDLRFDDGTPGQAVWLQSHAIAFSREKQEKQPGLAVRVYQKTVASHGREHPTTFKGELALSWCRVWLLGSRAQHTDVPVTR